jgi:ParB/RepB/Spo0J family partition protein
MPAHSKYELKYLPVEKLVANSWNPQEMKEPELARLIEEFRDIGCIVPLSVKPMPDGTYRIIGGEHRWKAAQVVGLQEVPCLLLDSEPWADEDLQQFVTVRLNIIQGKLNPEKFIKMYNNLTDKYGVEAMQKLLGFTDSHVLQKLVGQVKKGIQKSLPKEVQEAFNENAKEVKSVEELSQIIQKMFTEYGDTVQNSYMVFTHGGKQHLYIAMDAKMNRAMDKVVEYCRLSGEDINKFMAPITEACLKEADKKLEKVIKDKKSKTFDDESKLVVPKEAQ